MDFELTREQQAVRELAREFGLRQVAPVISASTRRRSFHAIMAELGKTLLGALVPENTAEPRSTTCRTPSPWRS